MRVATDVLLEGKGLIRLSQADHVATGGEGSVYRKNNFAIKIYTDPKKMLQDNMVDKVKLLSAIKHPSIVAPVGLVFNKSQKPIGYFMPYVSGEPLPRFFTNDFRASVLFGNDQANLLAEEMRAVVNIAHQHQALIVDNNENGWLVKYQKNHSPKGFVVDVDSWQIGQHKAKVIMPSIRDYHAKTFSEKSDWFSWGVLTFQLYTGIHPYKGTLAGFGRNDFVERMKANASVFEPGVRLNSAVRDFACIPPKLLNWYQKTFKLGLREAPPSPLDRSLSTAPHVTKLKIVSTPTSGKLKFQKIFSPPGLSVVKVFLCGIVLLSDGSLINLSTNQKIGRVDSLQCEIVRVDEGFAVLKRDLGVVTAELIQKNNKVFLLDLPKSAENFVRYFNRIFVVTPTGLSELELFSLAKPVLIQKQSWPVLINSTRWFDGLGVTDVFGNSFLVLPHGEAGVSTLKIPELNGLKVVSAKAGTRNAMVVVLEKQGDYKKYNLVFSSDYLSYQIKSEYVDSADLNLVQLERGVNAEVVGDKELEITVPTSGAVNKLSNVDIKLANQLFDWEGRVLTLKDGDLWQITIV
jgi:hypothetical protein